MEVDRKLLSTFGDKNIVCVGGDNGQVAFFFISSWPVIKLDNYKI